VLGPIDTRQERDAVEFLVRFARAAHEAGYPTSELESRVRTVGRVVELSPVEVSATPTVIELIVGSIAQQRSFTLRTTPSSVDLDRTSRLDALVAALTDGAMSIEEARSRLEEIERGRLNRPFLVGVLAYGVASSSLAVVLGGGWREAVAAVFVGLAVGLVALVRLGGVRGEQSDVVRAPIAALVASLAAGSIVWAGLDAAPDRVTLAALVVMLPGMTLTIGMRELATNHLLSGLSNTAAALIRLLGLVFGVAAGAALADRLYGDPQLGTLDPFPNAAVLAAAVVSGLAFVVTLRAPSRDALFTCTAALLAVSASLVTTPVVGDAAGVFVAALAVGLAGSLLARTLRRSPLVFIVPGVLVLVPGSAGFQSASDLLEGRTVRGVDAAIDTLVTALAIVYGLIMATILLPEERPEDA